MLSALNRAGLDSVAIEEATGIERVRQNMWSVAVTVPPPVPRPRSRAYAAALPPASRSEPLASGAHSSAGRPFSRQAAALDGSAV